MGQHVVVTGASAGIGKAIAKAFASKGAKLTLVARRRGLLEALADEVDVDCHIVEQDLSDTVASTSFLDDAVSALGPVDVLINNAGVQIIEAAHEVDADAQERMLAVDLLTPLRLCRAVLPDMVERKSGCVVNISSVAALAPVPGMTAYNAAKAGLASYSESLAGELKGSGVHVVTVYPGPVHTDMGDAGAEKYEQSLAFRMQSWGDADVLGQKVVRAVEKKQKRLVYPASYGGVRHLPDGLVRTALDVMTPGLKK